MTHNPVDNQPNNEANDTPSAQEEFNAQPKERFTSSEMKKDFMKYLNDSIQVYNDALEEIEKGNKKAYLSMADSHGGDGYHATQNQCTIGHLNNIVRVKKGLPPVQLKAELAESDLNKYAIEVFAYYLVPPLNDLIVANGLATRETVDSYMKDCEKELSEAQNSVNGEENNAVAQPNGKAHPTAEQIHVTNEPEAGNNPVAQQQEEQDDPRPCLPCPPAPPV